MSINLTRFFKGEDQKAKMTATKAATAFDHQTFKGFGYVFKADSPMVTDRAVRSIATNSAIATRLQGTKLW
jgi:hypothetical protein